MEDAEVNNNPFNDENLEFVEMEIKYTPSYSPSSQWPHQFILRYDWCSISSNNRSESSFRNRNSTSTSFLAPLPHINSMPPSPSNSPIPKDNRLAIKICNNQSSSSISIPIDIFNDKPTSFNNEECRYEGKKDEDEQDEAKKDEGKQTEDKKDENEDQKDGEENDKDNNNTQLCAPISTPIIEDNEVISNPLSSPRQFFSAVSTPQEFFTPVSTPRSN